jgi:polar amino acid transport system substrate-binding protein
MISAAVLVSPFTMSAVRSPAATDPRVQDLVNAGKVRAGIGLTPLALTKDPVTGDLRGVALDLGRALAARIGVELYPVIYPR